MSLLPLSSVLWLLAGAPSAPASGLVLHEGLPEHLEVDGKLDEWKDLPSFTLGAAQQVAGKSKVSSPEDLSAQVWLALGPQGLAVAGEVHDDHVQLATQREQINDDHVEVWLAFPQPKMPALAFANQFGEHEVATVEDCKDLNDTEPADCARWWKQQVERRKALRGAFVTQYGVLAHTLVNYGNKTEVGRAETTPMPGGYRFEALIPWSAFPRASQAPLRDLQVLVDLIDSDEGHDKLETFLSSSSRRKFGDPSTFNAVKLATPLHLGTWPELFERLFKANESASYQPDPAVQRFQVWVNSAAAYQFTPSSDSPSVVEVDLSKPGDVARLGDVEVHTVPAVVTPVGEPKRWVISHRGQQLLDTQDLYSSAAQATPLSPRQLLLLYSQEGTLSPLGSGACGACPRLYLSVAKMDAKGHFSKPVDLEDTSTQGEELTWKASPDLSRIEVFVQHDSDAKAPPTLVDRFTLDPKSSTYKAEHLADPKDE